MPAKANEQQPERVRLTVEEAQALGEAAMRGAGFTAEEARILTDHVMDAALSGYGYSGLPKLLNIVDAKDFQKTRRPVRVVKETGPTALMDGGENVGMLAIDYATDETIRRARQHGLAIVCLYDSWMSGRSAYYCERIARAGLIGVHTVSASPLVAPFGGTEKALGTNPIAFGFPADPDPLVIDMGTSAFMGTDLQFRGRAGAALPEGVALDAEGKPTTDPAAATAGALLPFGGPEGGYKGFGLALAMDALGALAAGLRAPGDVRGYLFIAFKPDLFTTLEAYRQEVAARIARIKAVPRLPGVAEIRIPGERGYQTRARLKREGIEIDAHIRDALQRLAAGHLDHGG